MRTEGLLVCSATQKAGMASVLALFIMIAVGALGGMPVPVDPPYPCTIGVETYQDLFCILMIAWYQLRARERRIRLRTDRIKGAGLQSEAFG